jgi:twitching motility protein PilU
MLDINKLLSVMKEYDASDLYLTVDSAPCYRIKGNIKQAGARTLTEDETEAFARSIMSDKQQKEFEATNEMNLGLLFPSMGRFRVNAFRQRGSVGLVIRRIKTEIPTFEQLLLPPIFKEIAMYKRGLVLVVGATGSGKSTTMSALIGHRNENQAGHIITVEDPIEYVHPHKKSIVTQREIGLDTEDYHSALKNALRQAPDVILIGEIRDLETMEAALSFAETGHLCLATLHSNNANQAMERVMNFFPVERHKQIYLQLSLNLQAVVSQRLVKTVDNSRIAAIEILLGSPRVKDLIHKGQIDEIKDAMEKGATIGMQTFDMHLFDLYSQGRISMEEALKNADSVNNLRLKIKLKDDGEVTDQLKSSKNQSKETSGNKLENNKQEGSMSLLFDK